MKKIFMTIAAAFVAVSMNAQVYLGGGIGFQSKSYDGNSTSSFNFIPEIGYSLDENSAIGLGFGFSTSGKDESKQTAVSVNPYYRYNVVKFDKVKLFLDGTFEFETVKGNGFNDDDYKENSWGLGVRPGVAVNLNDNISFVSTFGFFGYKSSKPDGDKATNRVALGLDASQLTFGLFYNF